MDKKCYFLKQLQKYQHLLLLHQGNRIVYGDNIYKYYKPQEVILNQQATRNNIEPLAFSGYEMGSFMSDQYCYLDLSPEELKAKGSGGLRQMHNYCTLDTVDQINTPPDDYEPDKVGVVDMGQIRSTAKSRS